MKDENQAPSGRKNLLTKGLIIAVLTIILVAPTLMLINLIAERQNRRNQVVDEIGAKWGGRQAINGPILKLPYHSTVVTTVLNAKKVKEIRKERVLTEAYFLPEDLYIKGRVSPEKKQVGIFQVNVYNSELKLNGSFKDLNLKALGINPEDVLWDKTSLLVQLGDIKGLKAEILASVNGNRLKFNSQTTTLGRNALETPVFTFTNSGQALNFDFSLDLKGSESLSFIPNGNTTSLELESNWPDPGFYGSSLPEKSEVSSKGFKAGWKTMHLNRNYPQQFNSNNIPVFSNSAFGVRLLTPNDNYQKSERSVKYSILIIALTFLAFFFSELLNAENVHPFQYGLIGIALCIFYTLLISISEFTSFNTAYMIASLMTISLIVLYSRSLFSGQKTPFLIGIILSLLYGFIYVIIQLEDTALLIGSLGLFTILAATMYFSGKIKWYAAEPA